VFAAQAGAATLSRSESALLNAMNRVRTKHSLAPLVADVRLERAARQHSVWMLHTGHFAHTGFGWRIAHSHARGPTFGENLAWGVGAYASATKIVEEWLASPSHRANLLRPGFHRIGLGCFNGNFAGYQNAAVVTADFAGH
jgi:uncharacterized protein YkwD